MIAEFVLLALVQVPTVGEAVYELQPQSYHQTLRECQLSRKAKLQAPAALSYECSRKEQP